MSTEQKTFADLEWPALLEQLANRCVSRAGAERARTLRPEASIEAARARSTRSAEAMDLLVRGEALPIDTVVELGDVLERLDRGGDATAAEFHNIRKLLQTAQILRKFVDVRRTTHPALASALFTNRELDKLLNALDFAIDPDGGLADRASAELARARQRAGDLRQRIVSRLEELIVRYAEVLQDRYYTVRDGRYVLPVRSDSHIRVPGIVLGSSASGATLFIEPRTVNTLGNQLKVAQADVEREEARVLAELSTKARWYSAMLLQALEACTEADLLAAIARFGDALQAIAIPIEDEPVLELRAARHPLLQLAGIAVVSNDLSVRSGHCLVISGPNAGGKTVALKCLGLAAMMARTGLPIPVAEGSRIGWFEPVLTDVGDDQSIARSLSTFSAHVTNLAHILRDAQHGALVLLDELAGGTDPEEGQALAASVLDRLARNGAAVAVTTHYEALKTLAVRDERFENASVGFDLKTMMPTFTVTMGIPGASSALAVASRYGIPDEVLSRARELLPEHSVGREDVLRKIQDEQLSTQLARQAAEEEARQAARLRTELEAERNLVRAREQAKIQKEAQELLAALRAAREELRQAEARIKRKKATEQDLREAEKRVDSVASLVSIGGPLAAVAQKPQETRPERRRARDEELRVGARVWIARLNNSVEIIDAPMRGQVRVAAGALKLYVNVDEVLLEERSEPENTDSAAVPAANASKRNVPEASNANEPIVPTRVVRTTSNTVDLRGLRTDDALAMLDAFLDRLYGAGETDGFVLHGHGTGALKLAVREHLKDSDYVVRSQPAEPEDGGDAFTAFVLRS